MIIFPNWFQQQQETPEDDFQYEPATWWGWVLWWIAASPVGVMTYLVTTIFIDAWKGMTT